MSFLLAYLSLAAVAILVLLLICITLHTHTHGLISEATLLGNWEKYQAAMQENMKVALTKGAC